MSVSDVMGEGNEAEKSVSEDPEHTGPLSGMNLSSSIPFYSISSVGPEISLHDINFLSQSPSLSIRSTTSQNLGCSLPMNVETIPEPLVAFCTSDSNSSEENNVIYGLRSRVVLTDSPLGLSKFTGNNRGRGGGPLSRGRGRKSNLTHAKEKSLFDQAVGTQLTLHGVLRATNPLSMGA